MLDRYLTMKDNQKFPAVMVIEPFLGIEMGTELRFDWASGKYVSMTQEEDISEDYYYSGFAIALDPYLVKDNIGTYFIHIEQPVFEKVDEKKEPVVEVPVKEPISETPVETEKVISGPEFEDEPAHTLVIDCACGARRVLDTVKAPGITAYIMANDEDTAVRLHCEECGSKLKLWFAPDMDIIS